MDRLCDHFCEGRPDGDRNYDVTLGFISTFMVEFICSSYIMSYVHHDSLAHQCTQ